MHAVEGGMFYGVSEPVEEIRFPLPASWKRELKVAASAQAISLSDLMRLITREFLRGRYAPDEREALR